jgi:site-specific recombinase XerD
MNELGRKFRQHMVLRGFAEKTKDAYEHAMSELALAYGGVSPDLLTCEQIQAHVAHLIEERHLAWSTVNVHVSAFGCFYREMLKRRGDAFSLPPRGRSRKRPTVLDRESVRLILAAHTNIKHRALLAMVYGSGLRVSEVCRLRPCHIESAADRMLVRVEQSKGRKDRYTLLAHSALTVLRAYWLECRPGEWLFPGVWGIGPLSVKAAQRVYTQACVKTGIDPARAHGIHTLRHCFASHLMEDGVALPVIQRLLGHSALSTTAVYCHVSRAMLQNVRSPADTLGGWSPSGGKG